MMPRSSNSKKRVNSTIHTEKKEEKTRGKEWGVGDKKKRRDKRVCSESKPFYKNKEKKRGDKKVEEKSDTHRKKACEQKGHQQDPHFMTVADLSSDVFAETSEPKRLQTPIQEFQQQSTVKHQQPKVDNKTKMPNFSQTHKQPLQQTIGKIKNRQETMDILNRTINTRLIDTSPSVSPTNRLNVYEIQMNFYIQKISQLQKQLHEKNKLLATVTDKSQGFNTVVKNNHKLICENHRLRDERQLLERENTALKSILLGKKRLF